MLYEAKYCVGGVKRMKSKKKRIIVNVILVISMMILVAILPPEIAEFLDNDDIFA